VSFTQAEKDEYTLMVRSLEPDYRDFAAVLLESLAEAATAWSSEDLMEIARLTKGE
jgi:hypothetical protein